MADAVVIGIHLGLDGYHHRVVRDNLGPNNIQWNLRYFRGIDRNRGSLVYAHYTFRSIHLCESWVAASKEVLKLKYVTAFEKKRSLLKTV